MSQFVEVRFRPQDTRSYTYANEGAPLAVGDKGNVETRDGTVTVTVTAVDLPAPPFACKPITKFVPEG